MAEGKVGLAKEHGVNTCGHLTVCNINKRGCTETGETRSRIGPDAVTPPGGRPASYKKTEKGWKDGDHW